jgi:hypothetical protein
MSSPKVRRMTVYTGTLDPQPTLLVTGASKYAPSRLMMVLRLARIPLNARTLLRRTCSHLLNPTRLLRAHRRPLSSAHYTLIAMLSPTVRMSRSAMTSVKHTILVHLDLRPGQQRRYILTSRRSSRQ